MVGSPRFVPSPTRWIDAKSSGWNSASSNTSSAAPRVVCANAGERLAASPAGECTRASSMTLNVRALVSSAFWSISFSSCAPE